MLYKLIAPTPFGSDQETGKSRHVLRYSNRMNATRARVQWLIPTLRKRSKPWAILCRHPPVPEVAEDSANPCLVSRVRSMASGRDTAVQSAVWPDLCAPLRQSPAGTVRTTQVLAIVSEP